MKTLIVASVLLASVIFGLVLLIGVARSAEAGCLMSYCQEGSATTREITNEHRQIIGDLYDPGHNRRVQIRNNSRQILGYVERAGTVRNTRGQEVLEIEVPERSD